MHWKVISFYSEPEKNSTYYTEHAKRLISECEEYDLDYHIEELSGKGDYFKNCRMKPQFIQACMDKFNMPLLWLDIDSTIHTKPDLEYLSKYDFAAVKSPRKYQILAHSLFFNETANARSILNNWKKLCDNEKGEKVGDHSLLCGYLHSKKIRYGYIQDFTDYGITPVSRVRSKRRG